MKNFTNTIKALFFLTGIAFAVSTSLLAQPCNVWPFGTGTNDGLGQNLTVAAGSPVHLTNGYVFDFENYNLGLWFS